MIKKKGNCHLEDFDDLVNKREKIKESEKRNKYLNLVNELRMQRNFGDCDHDCNWCPWNGSESLDKERGRTGNRMTN